MWVVVDSSHRAIMITKIMLRAWGMARMGMSRGDALLQPCESPSRLSASALLPNGLQYRTSLQLLSSGYPPIYYCTYASTSQTSPQ
jgi:hypothetical protein